MNRQSKTQELLFFHDNRIKDICNLNVTYASVFDNIDGNAVHLLIRIQIFLHANDTSFPDSHFLFNQHQHHCYVLIGLFTFSAYIYQKLV